MNAELKVGCVVAGMAAGADSIDDMDVLRRGAMDRLFGGIQAKLSAMPRNWTGPLRTGSARANRRITGAVAVVAVLGLVAAIVSDEFAGGFWNHHSLLSGIVASVIVVALSVAVINEALERRTRRRWRVLAQHVMLELTRDARLTWMGIMELTRLLPSAESPSAWIEAAAGIVRDTPRLS